MPSTVVLIEPQAFMRQALASRLKLLGIEAPWICDSLEQAWPYLEHQESGLIVANMALDPYSGLDLLWWLRSRGKRVPLLLMSEDADPVLAGALRPFGCHLGRPHPAHVAEVFKRLEQNQFQLHFEFERLSLYDLVQLLAQARLSTHLYLTDVQTGAEGLMHVHQGKVQHAVFADLTGEEAFFRIMGLSQGMFMEMDTGSLAYYTIEADTQQLMARSALLQDEALLEPVALAVLENDALLSRQLERHFSPQRLGVHCFSLESAGILPELNPRLLIARIEALGEDLSASLIKLREFYTGSILLVGEQLMPGVSEALGLSGVDQFYLRPVQLEELLACLQHRCFSQAFSGQLKRLSLFDCLQILGMSPVPLRLHCLDALSGEQGEILLGSGRIWSVSFGARTGGEALRLCLELSAGLITCGEGYRPAEANIDQPLAKLLMNLAVQQGEMPRSILLPDGRELRPGYSFDPDMQTA